MNNDFPFPDNQDKLFKEFNDDFRHNAIIRTGIDQFLLFSEAYKTAATKLFEQLDGSALDANVLVYPLIFLNRQFLELRLKELIVGLNFTIFHERKFTIGHNLKCLWDTYKDLVLQIETINIPDAKILKNTENLILEFNSIDSNSISFRYPVDKAENPSLNMTNVDLQNFMTTMRKLYNFFDTQSDLVFHMVDLTEDLIDYMRSCYEH
ncbi:MAG: hypothetical protein ACOX5L_08510 [Bacteroidales bacterium]|jgi:hypothetical protein